MAIFARRSLTSSIFKFRPTIRTMSTNDDILLESNQNVGIITLNRPKQLNALNLSMVEKILKALETWETSKKLVIVKGAGDKAFCAGGDVRTIAVAAHEGKYDVGSNFFKAEYKMNSVIGHYKIPYIAVMNGITMGGGVGISVHGRYRIATEKTLFAMPETKIGFFPDVGGSYFLPRLEGYLGLFLGLTGYRLKGVDVYNAAIATHYCDSAKLPELEAELMKCSDDKDIQQTLAKYQPKDLPPFVLIPNMAVLNKCFSAFTVEGILDNLKSDDSQFAKDTLQTLTKMSPTSLKVTHAQFYKGMKISLNRCLDMELLMAEHAIKTNDFYEGVKAVLIDKDGKPKWDPTKVDQVTPEIIKKYFTESTKPLINKL